MRHLSRRELLLASAAVPAAAAQPPVIDTHMHVWSMDKARYPFKPPEPNYRPPKQDGSIELYLEEMKKDGVDLAVLVQERSSGWNNSYIAHSVRRFPKRFVGHGLIDPRDPGNAAVLEREVKQNGLSGMRLSPIYHPPNRYPDDQWLNAPYNYQLWKKAGETGVVFNVYKDAVGRSAWRRHSCLRGRDSSRPTPLLLKHNHKHFRSRISRENEMTYAGASCKVRVSATALRPVTAGSFQSDTKHRSYAGRYSHFPMQAWRSSLPRDR